MSKLHIRKGDEVIILTGKDKGQKGKVLKVFVKEQKAQGGIIKQEAPIHISNLSLIDPKSGKATRVSIKHEGKNVIRIAKKSGEEIK